MPKIVQAPTLLEHSLHQVELAVSMRGFVQAASCQGRSQRPYWLQLSDSKGDAAMRLLRLLIMLSAMLVSAPHVPAEESPTYDCIIRGGSVYDGSGKAAVRTDIAIRGDQIAAIGDLANAKAKTIIDAAGLA